MTYDERQLKEIHFALLYAAQFAHGTAGHNQYILIARLAQELGFYLQDGALWRNGQPVKG